jgi:CHAT domain-containing protein/tetratricopeptide (TPR) repeat protein
VALRAEGTDSCARVVRVKTHHRTFDRGRGWLPLLVACSVGAGASRAVADVVVEEVERSGAGALAGLRPGDVVLSWSRAAHPPANPDAQGGPVLSPFDLNEAELEQAPRGPVSLHVRRDGQVRDFDLPRGVWGLSTHPLLPGPEIERLLEARRLERSQAPAEAARLWERAAADVHSDEDGALVAWLLSQAVEAYARARLWEDADTSLRRADAALGGPHRAVRRTLLMRQACTTLQHRGAFEFVVDCAERTLRAAEEAAPESLLTAIGLANAGRVANVQGDLERSEQYQLRALEMRAKLSPASDVHAASLNNLGGVAFHRGDLMAAESYFRQALAIGLAWEGETGHVAAFLNNLGEVLRERGDLDGAYEQQRQALAIRVRLDPDSSDVAASLENLAELARARGDLATAERHLTEAAKRWTRSDPDSQWTAKVLSALGNVQAARGDFAAAEAQFRHAALILERDTPHAVEWAEALDNLGLVLFEQGNRAGAEETWERARELKQRAAPESLSLAATLERLGQAAQERGEMEVASARLRRALAIRADKAPRSLAEAASRFRLGDLERTRGNLHAAEAELRAALGIQQRLAPASAALAESLHALGVVRGLAGDAPGATTLLCQAVDALEGQRTRLGGSDQARSAFGARYADHHQACIEALVDQNEPARAYEVLERARARSLLELMAERDLTFSGTLPPALARERALADADYDRAQAALAKLDPAKDAGEIDTQLSRLEEIGRRQADIATQIKLASPRLASLKYPQPLTLEEARAALDPGTVLFAYAVGRERTVLFVVEPASSPGPGVTAFALPVGAARLREHVDAFRQAILPQARMGREAMIARGAALYDLLVRPAQARLAASERLLISADGPLHSLPFAALVRTSSAARRKDAYLIEWKPIHFIASATVYAQVKKARRAAPGPGTLVAFGDPRYPASAAAPRSDDAEVRSAVAHGFDFTPLPRSRAEVEDIALLFPGRARTFLGEQATEERAKALDTDVAYVHFACHGSLDERFPLNSGLALTIPTKPADGQENGLLQAWEIFERVRLDADLVTLSACQTALGKDMGGEGLLGLTRAFLYAGAHSVLGSLWSVSDKSTALLMKRFYGYLKAGKSRDEALRAAQIDLIHTASPGPASSAGPSSPFRWAAFQLSGDWR